MRHLTTTSFQYLDGSKIEPGDVLEEFTNEGSLDHIRKSGREVWSFAFATDSSYFAWSNGRHILHLIPWDANKKKKHDPADIDGLNNRSYHVIDCGESIWSVVFGSGLPQKASRLFRHGSYDKNMVVATGLASGRIKLFNCFTGAVIVVLRDHKETVQGLDISKDGSLQLVSGSKDGTIKCWDLMDDGNMYCTHKVKGKVNACKFSSNGKFFGAVGTNKMVLLWHGSVTSKTMFKLDGHYNDVVSVDFSDDSVLMATASFDTKVIIWNACKAEKLKVLGHLFPSPSLIFAGGHNDNYVRHVSFSRDNVNVATVCDDGFVRFWNWEDEGDPVSVCRVTEPLCCQFSSDGSVLAVGSSTGHAVFLPAPNPVASLLQMSRVAVRKAIHQGDVNKLPVPSLLKQFLQYELHIVKKDLNVLQRDGKII